MLFIDLQEIAEQADSERLTIMVDQFKIEYPDIFETIQLLTDVTPSDAVAALIEQWPALIVIKLYPAHEALIALIQAEIRRRNQYG